MTTIDSMGITLPDGTRLNAVPDLDPDRRPGTSDLVWSAAFVRLSPPIEPGQHHDPANRIHIAGYGWLTFDRARKLAAALLSAVARGDHPVDPIQTFRPDAPGRKIGEPT
jgi:hypothetical protein